MLKTMEEKWSDKNVKSVNQSVITKSFTMKQFCKNQRSRSKKGEKKNETIRSKAKRYDPRNYTGRMQEEDLAQVQAAKYHQLVCMEKIRMVIQERDIKGWFPAEDYIPMKTPKIRFQ